MGVMYLSNLLGDGADLLISARGGTSIYVPSRLRDHHWLTTLLGVDLCARLIADAGGCKLFVPRPPKTRRNAAIVRDWLAGVTYVDLSQRYGLCERQIYRIVHNATVKNRNAIARVSTG